MTKVKQNHFKNKPETIEALIEVADDVLNYASASSMIEHTETLLYAYMKDVQRADEIQYDHKEVLNTVYDAFIYLKFLVKIQEAHAKIMAERRGE